MCIIILSLNRPFNELWVKLDKIDIEVLKDVTGVKRIPQSDFKGVDVLRNGKRISTIWYVDEIEEEW